MSDSESSQFKIKSFEEELQVLSISSEEQPQGAVAMSRSISERKPVYELSSSCEDNSEEERSSSSSSSFRNKARINAEKNGATIIINGGNACINIAPSYNFTKIDNKGPMNQNIGTREEERPEQRQDVPSREFLYPLYESRRVLTDDDIDLVAKNMGMNWKEVGMRLTFRTLDLQKFENETKSLDQATSRMLHRWVQWKDERATVGKLTKALILAYEFDAIRVLEK